MTTLQSLDRVIAKARHGTDAMWANYMGAAEASAEWAARVADKETAELENYSDGGYLAAQSVAFAFRAIVTKPPST